MSDTWQQFDYFPSSVYRLYKPEFLEDVKTVAYEYLNETKKKELDKIYPMYQTNNFYHEEKINSFTSYIAQTSWNILSSQGFDMNKKQTYFQEMWAHHYLKYGSMDYHVHSNNSHITGFYILEAPENSCQIVLHDPRPGKIQMNFGFNFHEEVFSSTDRINFKSESGMLMFTNSWLPHSFTRNASDEPFTFIHFNIGVKDYYPPPPPPAEVI